MSRASDYLKMIRAVMPAPEKKKYVTEPPRTHTYDRITYYYDHTIKPNMHMYIAKEGYRICFDDYELNIKR